MIIIPLEIQVVLCKTLHNMNRIPFRIAKIAIDDFSFDNQFKVCSDASIEIVSSFSFGVDMKESLIKCDSEYKYLLSEKEILLLKLSSFFEIEPEAFKDFYNSKGDFSINKDFLRHMATISVGAARGVIVSKSENTPIANVVLPPLNLMEAIKDDFIIPNA